MLPAALSVINPTQTQIAAIAEARRAARLHGTHLRQSARLTLAEVGRHVGVSGQTIWNWEEGKANPTGEAAVKYLSLLRELERIVA